MMLSAAATFVGARAYVSLRFMMINVSVRVPAVLII